MKALLKSALAGLLVLGTLAATVDVADAGPRNRNKQRFVAGVATGVIAGALLYGLTRPSHGGVSVYYGEPEPVCYRGPEQCTSRWRCWVDYYGRETCRRDWHCTRPVICD
jgi:hypothetical protein